MGLDRVYSEDAEGGPGTTGRSSTASSTPTASGASGPTSRSASCPRPSRPIRSPTSTWTPGGRESISTGWAYPPKDYAKWAELVFQWVRHSVERYGQSEVETWYWEVWNEPNILYWRGTPEEYHKLYDHAVDAVKRACPRPGSAARTSPAQVAGGHEVPPGLPRSLPARHEPCHRASGSPLDFIAFHAKGEPRFVDGHVRTGIASQLQDIDRGFEVVASYPELKEQADHHRRVATRTAARPARRRSTRRTATVTGPSMPATPPPPSPASTTWPSKHGVNFEGAVTWAFEFEDQPYFAGFRVLSTNGIPCRC